MRFPSQRLEDVEDDGKPAPALARHPEGKHCPAEPLLPRGTVVVRVFGRALDRDGKPVADTVRQEHYVEDRFHVPVALQGALAKASAAAGAQRFRVADDLARLLVSHAYLGQLDVNPVGAPGGRGNLKRCEFWARQVGAGGQGPARLRVEGRSEAVGASRDGGGNDGRLWQHEVRLVWEGLIEMQEGRMTLLLLLARGSEKLTWGNKLRELLGPVDVARLPAGHPIDLACEVRYGLRGGPVAADEAAAEAPAERGPDSVDQVPEEARRQLTQALGPTFMVFRGKVQEELKLSDAQKQKLEERLADTVQDAMRFFQTLEGRKPEEREKELGSYRHKAQGKLAAFLKETLKAEQLKRLRQLELQQEGPFALGHPDVARVLKITDEQRERFMGVVREMEKQIRPLIKEAQSGGKPEEIGPKVMKVRKDHEGKVEAILSAAQRKRWKEMLGKPFDLGD
jgi:hypothetical protein